jgi:hypothetical protein
MFKKKKGMGSLRVPWERLMSSKLPATWKSGSVTSKIDKENGKVITKTMQVRMSGRDETLTQMRVKASPCG